jgi:hypothetical protein
MGGFCDFFSLLPGKAPSHQERVDAVPWSYSKLIRLSAISLLPISPPYLNLLVHFLLL